MKIRILESIFFLLIWSNTVSSATYQWSVSLPSIVSPETNAHPTAYLWIPEHCNQVRAVVFGQHNMCEETLFNRPDFRQTLSELGFAIVWLTPGISQQWKVEDGCEDAFQQMMSDLAVKSGYSELKNVPIVPIGHSAMATFPWNFAAWNPDRTLAVISYHGDAPRTNLTGYGRENLEWGRTRNIDGIPGLMIEGEYEWWEARVNPALAFRMMYPESCVSFLCDAGHGHFDVSDEVVKYISLFLKKTAQYRLPFAQPVDGNVTLNKINPQYGWLAERWHPNQEVRSKPAPFDQYKGDTHDAFWYFDQEMAEATEDYYARERDKKHQYLSFEKDGNLLPFDKNLHAGIISPLNPEKDGLTFHIKAVFTDSLREHISADHSTNKPSISVICGPVRKVDDSTFTITFNRVGFDNIRRSGDIWLVASSKEDVNYKTTVQQLNLRINDSFREKMQQRITFPSIPNVTEGTKFIKLNALSESKMPVYYYVKEGPAEVDGNRLLFESIPPRAKFPVQVTVVAWQLGYKDKFPTAEPEERTFYITKK